MLQKFTTDILDKILIEIKKDKNMNKIHNNLIDPLVSYTFKKIYPYITTLFVLLILIVLIIIAILLLNIKNNFKK
tara:strand:+ start:480 stop:704 length:225 start_codon:yes stop_codon:yes gene_type:complete